MARCAAALVGLDSPGEIQRVLEGEIHNAVRELADGFGGDASEAVQLTRGTISVALTVKTRTPRRDWPTAPYRD
jgi:hypothetical protein